jgi:energy-coupling factor transporter ATP-binding protein EcfA2
MKIISLKAENVKRLSSVEITPEGDVIMIGGDNGAGKSSVLDSIAYVLGGAKLVPEEPIRQGQTDASITVDLGDFIVTREFSRPIVPAESGPAYGPTRSTLTVKSKDGAKYPTPQALLDKLYGELSFDPGKFAADNDPKRQAETLRRVIGLDTSDLDVAIATLTTDRTTAGRDVKTLEGKIAGLVHYDDAPLEPISAADVAAELQAANDKQNAATVAERTLAQAERDLAADVRSHDSYNEKRELLKKQIGELDKVIATYSDSILSRTEHVATCRVAVTATRADVPDMGAIKNRLVEVETVNKHVAANAEFAKLQVELADANRRYDALVQNLEAARGARLSRIQQAKYPIIGLGFNEAGAVTFYGVPFAQASMGEKLRVSVGIALALNPKLKVILIRDGSLLDSKNLAIIGALAADADAQVWIERVGTDGVSVVIEDGAIRS